MNAPQPRIARIPEAMPVSRILRFLIGVAIVAWGLPPVLRATPPNQLRVVAAFAGLVVFYGVVHWVVARYLTWLHPWLGAFLAVLPVIAVALQGSIGGIAAVLYIGVSLVVIALSGQPGCEVLAIQALVLRQPTHLACLFFSPLDWLEKGARRLVGRA